jgi:hypothetical protein
MSAVGEALGKLIPEVETRSLLQVWSDGKPPVFLGYVRAKYNKSQPYVDFPYRFDPEDRLDVLRLKIAHRAVFISNTDLLTTKIGHTLDMLGFPIPGDAEILEDMARDGKTFPWQVLTVDADLYDILFDLDQFEPHYNGADLDNPGYHVLNRPLGNPVGLGPTVLGGPTFDPSLPLNPHITTGAGFSSSKFAGYSPSAVIVDEAKDIPSGLFSRISGIFK